MRKRNIIIVSLVVAIGLIASVATFAGSSRTKIRPGGLAVIVVVGDSRVTVTCRRDTKSKKPITIRGNYYFVSQGTTLKVFLGGHTETIRCVKPKKKDVPAKAKKKGKVLTIPTEPVDENSDIGKLTDPVTGGGQL